MRSPAAFSLPLLRWATWFLSGLLLTVLSASASAQNSMVGDGFGGRLWYRPTNYAVGSYSAFSLCYSDPCDSSSNQLYGWGSDYGGTLGNGIGLSPSPVPVAVPGMTNLRYCTSGYWTGAIKNDNSGWVWSSRAEIQTIDPFPFPAQVIEDVKFMDTGTTGACFVKNDGSVWCIGQNALGQFGDGSSTSNYDTPVQMAGVEQAVRLACGHFTNYVLLSDGTVLAVGDNEFGQLGTGSDLSRVDSVVPIPDMDRIVDIKANYSGAAVLNVDGEVYCWGIGLGDLPVHIAGLNDIVAISGCADGYHFLALDADKNGYRLGDMGTGGAMGTDPVLVATDVIDILAGEDFSYIVKSDGSLWAAGSSTDGFDGLIGSIWLNLSNSDLNGNLINRPEYTQLDPSAVLGGCPVQGTVAIAEIDCDGSNGFISVNHFSGQAPYQYDIGTGPQSSNTFSNLSAGTYTVTVTDVNGCVVAITCILTAEAPVATAQAEATLITLGSGTTLSANGGNSFSWYPGTGLSCTDCPSPSVSPMVTTEYCVVVGNTSGCANDTACVLITVSAGPSPCTPTNIFVPSAFSPDVSGKNDQQCVQGTACIASMTFGIYNRWGNKVFETTDPEACWDGTYNGQALDPAVFVYHLTATLTNGETLERQGNITLMR